MGLICYITSKTRTKEIMRLCNKKKEDEKTSFSIQTINKLDELNSYKQSKK